MELRKDANGNIITMPVTGWSTTKVAGMAIILAVEYVETPEELERGESKQIPLVLTPQQCLALADQLQRGAMTLLAPLPPDTPLQ